MIAALLVAGDFSDVLGRRPVLMFALGLSVLSAVCFLGESGLPLLFVGRLLSGFSAGLLSGAATVAVLELAPPQLHGWAAFAVTCALPETVTRRTPRPPLRPQGMVVPQQTRGASASTWKR